MTSEGNDVYQHGPGAPLPGRLLSGVIPEDCAICPCCDDYLRPVPCPPMCRLRRPREKPRVRMKHYHYRCSKGAWIFHA